MNDALQPVIDALKQAERVLFVTGAGLSADSGLPTYRGTGGLYDVDVTEDGVEIEDALSGPMFRRNPELVWKYIREIEAACRGARPNAGHLAIAALEQHLAVTVLTQNVDGLHTDAGSSDVIEIHGNLRELHCTACEWTDQVRDYEGLSLDCPACGGLIRPRVVLFEEMLPLRAVSRLEAALQVPFDLVFAVGTSALFPYIAAPVVFASREGRTTVEINPGETPLSEVCDHVVRLRAAEALPLLVP